MNDEMYESRNSIYCYEGTNVLKNKLNIRDFKDLQKIEARLSAAKLLDLRQRGITGNFDKNHLINLHKYIFEDLYYFAGEFRKENIAKGHFSFAEWIYIDEQLDNILLKLKNENYLENIKNDKMELSKRLAFYLSELNVLHPFREGNGRTLREFIRQLALKNGYRLNLIKTEPKDFLNASIESTFDTKNLENKIYDCLEEVK
jgi:cell filamentation protein